MNIQQLSAILVTTLLVIHYSAQADGTPSLTDTTRPKETLTMKMPKPSRPAPPKVEPIKHKGVRYEQDMQSSRYGGTQQGGYLVAINPTTGERLWMLKVYEVPTQTDAPMQAARYFRSMKLVPEHDEIEIESEVGGRYLVDLIKHSSTWLSGPDSEHKSLVTVYF